MIRESLPPARPSRREAMTFGGVIGGLGMLWPAALRAQQSPITTRIMVEDNRLWVGATIGDSKPYLFVVDTGAYTNFIRPEIAQELKLKTAGGRFWQGLGKDKEMGGVVLAQNVAIGGNFRQDQAEFNIYDFKRGLPKDAAGLFAAGLFTTRDSEVDFEKGAWHLWPRGRPNYDGLTEIRSTLDIPAAGTFSNKMIATVYLDGQPYRLLLDTGAPGTVLLQSEAARRSGLFRDDVPFAPQQSAGFGGTAAKLSRVVRIKSLQMGPLAIDRPLITLMNPDNDHELTHDGLLGLSCIQLLRLATDTRRRKLWAARNALPSPPDRYRMAGLWIDKTPDGGAKIGEVGFGSPAYQAGLRTGDRIAEPTTFGDALRRIAAAPNREVSLTVSRGSETIPARYTIKPWL